MFVGDGSGSDDGVCVAGDPHGHVCVCVLCKYDGSVMLYN